MAMRVLCALGALLVVAAEDEPDRFFLRKAPAPADPSGNRTARPKLSPTERERRLQDNWDFVSGTLELNGHINVNPGGGQDMQAAVMTPLRELIIETIEELTGQLVRRVDLDDKSDPSQIKCADFANYGSMKQFGFESKVTGAWFALGYLGDESEASCLDSDDTMTIRFVNQPISLNTGSAGSCQFLHPELTFVQNLAFALGYNYGDVLESVRDPRGCTMMALDSCGLTNSANGNFQTEHPKAIRFRAPSTRKNLDYNYQVSAAPGRGFAPMMVLVEAGEPPTGDGSMRERLTAKMALNRFVQHLNTLNWCVKTDRFVVGPTTTSTAVGATPSCPDGSPAGPNGCPTAAPAVTTTTFCAPWVSGCITQTTTTMTPCVGAGPGCLRDTSRAECTDSSNDPSCWLAEITTTPVRRCDGPGPGCIRICTMSSGGCEYKSMEELEGVTTTTGVAVAADLSVTAEPWFMALIAASLIIAVTLTCAACFYVSRVPEVQVRKKADQNVVVVTAWGAKEITGEHIETHLGASDAARGNRGPRLAASGNNSRDPSPVGSRASSREPTRFDNSHDMSGDSAQHRPSQTSGRGRSPSPVPSSGSNPRLHQPAALLAPGAGGASRPSPAASRGRTASPNPHGRGPAAQQDGAQGMHDMMKLAEENAHQQAHLLAVTREHSRDPHGAGPHAAGHGSRPQSREQHMRSTQSGPSGDHRGMTPQDLRVAGRNASPRPTQTGPSGDHRGMTPPGPRAAGRNASPRPQHH